MAGRGTEPVEGVVTSADGTAIAWQRIGSGRPLVLVEPAGGYRDFGSLLPLARALAGDRTAYRYDRRGRGLSGNTPPYAVEREIEDLAAVADAARTAAGGAVPVVYGTSSGALLAMHAVAAGVAIDRLVLFEPPLDPDDDRPAETPFTAEIRRLVAEGRRSAAADAFLAGVGVPEELVEGMGPAKAQLDAVADTLVHDCVISDATRSPLFADVRVPTLVLDSEGSSEDLTGWAASVAAALPDAVHRSLSGGWHGVAEADLAAAVVAFVGG